MPPLTSPPGPCDGCLRLSHKVAELEIRVSLLHQIGEDKRFIDTMLAQGCSATAVAAAGGDLDDAVPWTNPAELPTEDQWAHLGAKPRTLRCSTPGQPSSCRSVHRRGGSVRLSPPCPPPAAQDICLTNRFNVLDRNFHR